MIRKPWNHNSSRYATPLDSARKTAALAGRVRNLGLPASAVNALIPLFEAVSNALHAIEARWENESTERGTIAIKILRREDKVDQAIVGAVAELVGIEGGVVSGVLNPGIVGVGAPT